MTPDFTIVGLHTNPPATHAATASVSAAPACNTWDSHNTTSMPPNFVEVAGFGAALGVVIGVKIGRRLQRRETNGIIKNLLSGGGKRS